MAAVRDGTLSVEDATARLFTQAAPMSPMPAAAPQKPQTVTEMMAAVRRGEPGAQAALETAMKGVL